MGFEIADQLRISREKVRMTQLSGRTHIKMDSKGRMSLPVQFRACFSKSKSVVITNGVFQGHPYLDFYSMSEWRKVLGKVAKWPKLLAEAQLYRRFYISSAQECEIDGQARVIVPSYLRGYSQLEEEVVVLGMENRLEIWSSAQWNDLFKKLDGQFESILPVVSALDQNLKKGARS